MGGTDEKLLNALCERVMPGEIIRSIQRLGGLTNRSYHVVCSNGEFVFRLPGEGTETLINRKDEEISTILASKLGIDAELIFFDSETGYKISRYIANAITMNDEKMKDSENIQLVADIFSKLHSSNIDTAVEFDVFDMAERYERIIKKAGVGFFENYDAVRKRIFHYHEKDLENSSIKKVTCHNDPLCENWVRNGHKMYLVDWEYAGMNERMWDLADISIEAGFDKSQDNLLLSAYCQNSVSDFDKERFAINKVYIDFLWSLWGKAREPYEGLVMREYGENRFARLLTNLQQMEEGQI